MRCALFTSSLPDLDSTAVLSLFISCLVSILLLIIGLITRLPLLLTLALSLGALGVGVIVYREKQKTFEDRYKNLETLITTPAGGDLPVYKKGTLEFRFRISQKGNVLRISITNQGLRAREISWGSVMINDEPAIAVGREELSTTVKIARTKSKLFVLPKKKLYGNLLYENTDKGCLECKVTFSPCPNIKNKTFVLKVIKKEEESSSASMFGGQNDWRGFERKIERENERNKIIASTIDTYFSYLIFKNIFGKVIACLLIPCGIAGVFSAAMFLLSCGNPKETSIETTSPLRVVVDERTTDSLSANVSEPENVQIKPEATPDDSYSSSDRSYDDDSDELDNLRGFDPPSEDDMDDMGMQRYMDNNDEEGWY